MKQQTLRSRMVEDKTKQEVVDESQTHNMHIPRPRLCHYKQHASIKE